jgi:pyruvate/2-oxoglutarate dehydrogenase complex dihydrolipoamide acyltransferase (E2) component
MSRSRALTGWRRIASAMWRPPDDPQIFGAFEVDARPVRDLIDRARRAGTRVTPTHVVGRALAHAIEEVPDLNVRIRSGRAYPRPSIDIFFITAVAGGHDLSGVKIERTAEKSVVEVADELARRGSAQKRGADPDLARSKRAMDLLPHRLLRRALRATAYLAEDRELDVPLLGLRRAPFGSAMVTSVGMLGLPQGFAPLAWMYDVPLIVLVGEIAPRAVVVDGRIEAREMLPLTATIDHRYVDGWHISQAMAAFRAYLAAPADFEPALAELPQISPN